MSASKARDDNAGRSRRCDSSAPPCAARCGRADTTRNMLDQGVESTDRRCDLDSHDDRGPGRSRRRRSVHEFHGGPGRHRAARRASELRYAVSRTIRSPTCDPMMRHPMMNRPCRCHLVASYPGRRPSPSTRRRSNSNRSLPRRWIRDLESTPRSIDAIHHHPTRRTRSPCAVDPGDFFGNASKHSAASTSSIECRSLRTWVPSNQTQAPCRTDHVTNTPQQPRCGRDAASHRPPVQGTACAGRGQGPRLAWDPREPQGW